MDTGCIRCGNSIEPPGYLCPACAQGPLCENCKREARSFADLAIPAWLLPSVDLSRQDARFAAMVNMLAHGIMDGQFTAAEILAAVPVAALKAWQEKFSEDMKKPGASVST